MILAANLAVTTGSRIASRWGISLSGGGFVSSTGPATWNRMRLWSDSPCSCVSHAKAITGSSGSKVKIVKSIADGLTCRVCPRHPTHVRSPLFRQSPPYSGSCSSSMSKRCPPVLYRGDLCALECMLKSPPHMTFRGGPSIVSLRIHSRKGAGSAGPWRYTETTSTAAAAPGITTSAATASNSGDVTVHFALGRDAVVDFLMRSPACPASM